MGTGRDLHIDSPLSNLAVKAFDSGMGQFIGSKVFPIMPVNKQSNKYYIIDKGNFLRIHESARSPKKQANTIEFDVSSNSYFAHNYALASDLALEDLANADVSLMLRQNTMDIITVGLARDNERRIANTVTSISNLGSGAALTGGNKWNDYTNSSPMADVTTGHSFIRKQTGLTANTAIVDEDTLAVLRRHPELLDFYKYTSGGELSNDLIASALRVSTLLVGTGVIENALEGATSSMTNIWGNNCVLAHINPQAGPRTATLGLSMRWVGNQFSRPFAVTRQRFSGAGTRNVEVMEAQYFQDEKIVASELGYAITGTL